MRRIVLSPSWWLRHLLLIFLVALFLRLGWWQWEKGSTKHGTLQNLFYGIEWPFFAACVIFGWVKMIQEELSPTPPPEAGVGAAADAGAGADGGLGDATAPAGPGSDLGAGTGTGTGAGAGSGAVTRAAATSAAPGAAHSSGAQPDDDLYIDDDDEEAEELAEYNRYLAALNAQDQARSSR